MFCGICRAYGENCASYELQKVPIPSLEGLPPGSLLIRIQAASICGTDLFGANSRTGREPLGYLQKFASSALDGDHQHCGGSGHELLGEIVASVDPCKLPKGQWVLAMSPIYIQVMKTLSDRFESATGKPTSILPQAGGFAEYVVSHESCCLAVPSPHTTSIQMDPIYFVAAQPLGTVVHACRKLPGVLGKTVAIVGQGGNGLIFTQMMSRMGAKRVIALDLLEERLQVAKQNCGATHTVRVRTDHWEGALEQVRAINGGALCDIVVEVVGHNTGKTLDLCSQLSKNDGTVLLFGLMTPDGSAIQASHFVRNLKYICTSTPEMEDFELAIDLIHQGRFDPKPLFSHTFSFEKFSDAFQKASSYEDGVIKVLLTFDQIDSGTT